MQDPLLPPGVSTEADLSDRTRWWGWDQPETNRGAPELSLTASAIRVGQGLTLDLSAPSLLLTSYNSSVCRAEAAPTCGGLPLESESPHLYKHRGPKISGLLSIGASTAITSLS